MAWPHFVIVSTESKLLVESRDLENFHDGEAGIGTNDPSDSDPGLGKIFRMFSFTLMNFSFSPSAFAFSCDNNPHVLSERGVLQIAIKSLKLLFKSLRPDECEPDQLVFHSGSSRPNEQFQHLCSLAGVKPKQDVETGVVKPWVLKDLRKTCATYYAEHMPESSIEILGHSVGA